MSYFIGYFYRENSGGGGQNDFEGHIWFVIKSFQESFFYTIKNYGQWEEAVWPLYHILQSYFNPFATSQSSTQLSHTILCLVVLPILYLAIKEKFKNKSNQTLNFFLLSCIILLSPFFRTSAFWATTENISTIFLLTSILFFFKFKNALDNQKKWYLLLTCIFGSLTLYSRQYLFFFNILFLIYLAHNKDFKNLCNALIIYSFLSLPAIYLIYTWGALYDINSNSDYSNYISLDNIYSNSLCVLSVFFIYCTPFLILNLKNFTIFLQKHLLLVFLIILIIIFLPYEYKWLDGKITLGGGIPLKISILFFQNYLFLKICASFGLILFLFYTKIHFKNFIILFPILTIFLLPKIFFQEYMDPLIFIIFLLLIKHQSEKLILKNNFIFMLLIYELIILISGIYYQHFF